MSPLQDLCLRYNVADMRPDNVAASGARQRRLTSDRGVRRANLSHAPDLSTDGTFRKYCSTCEPQQNHHYGL
jgi:hypothetical protein